MTHRSDQMSAHDKVFERTPTTLADGEDTVIDARGMAYITVIALTGSTVTVSRVDPMLRLTVIPLATKP